MKAITTLLAAALMCILTACSTTTVNYEGEYVLLEFASLPADHETPITLSISGDQLSGKGPINRWNGKLDGDQIGLLISTKMAGPAELMQLESQLLRAITNSTIQLNGDKLDIIQEDLVVARFIRQ